MIELLDKQMNAQKENLIKKLLGFTQAPTSPRKKCVMKMKGEEENDRRLKYFDGRNEFIKHVWRTRDIE